MSNSETKSDSSEELRFLYDKLRTEINNNDALVMQLLNVTLVLVAAAMGFGLHEKTPNSLRPVIFFGAISILYMSMRQTIERMRGTFLIASYMRTFIEKKTEHIRWEVRLKEFRIASPKYGYQRFNTFLLIYVLLALINLILIILYSPPAKPIAVSIISVSSLFMLWMIYSAYKLYNRYVINHHDTFDKVWEEIADKEFADTPDKPGTQ